MLCHVHTQVVLLSYNFFLLEAFRSNSRGHHNDLGILFLQLEPHALQQLWRETISLLSSKVYWSCNQKSLPIKEGAHSLALKKGKVIKIVEIASVLTVTDNLLTCGGSCCCF